MCYKKLKVRLFYNIIKTKTNIISETFLSKSRIHLICLICSIKLIKIYIEILLIKNVTYISFFPLFPSFSAIFHINIISKLKKKINDISFFLPPV